MTYKSPAYSELERRTSIVKSINDHVDAAREYLTMGYGAGVTVIGSDRDGHKIERHLGENAKQALIAFMAKHHEDIAHNVNSTQIPAEIDVRAACKI